MTWGAMARCASDSISEVTWNNKSVLRAHGVADLTLDGGDIRISVSELEPVLGPTLAT